MYPFLSKKVVDLHALYNIVVDYKIFAKTANSVSLPIWINLQQNPNNFEQLK